ncbi:cytochrome c-type biogenesis protein CcsB [Actinoplanes lutulentus]|uniref:Cytochrome c-type biogenesis protein CcsB n=1 Tax=Actinoplanes lutulentus TaxID=1287878 RepID=A0A327Z5B5_9ACTN|nr:c-type cytochrome biogenesis protein CcsB [Actinoplanes lutulentus]MBB2945000.1 cytochrome c-type biogenesis protein CcsB [Actinoplanes lutulentus]RAK31794.1 cytochrome c-type biogenesis protein CcsB [Actinoplanes lutulentus]
MAELSNQLMAFTVFAYLIAMICYAGEYAFGKRSVIGKAASRQLVGAGAPVIKQPTAPDGPVKPGRGEWSGRIAVAFTLLGFVLHLGTTVTRGLAAERMPWGNMYEYILSASLVGAAVWVGVLLRKPNLRHLGLFASLSLVVLLGAASLVAYTPVGPLVPALNSYWFIFHVSTIIISSGIFLIGAVPAAMFLIKNGYDEGKRSFPYTLAKRWPDAGALERLTFRLHAFAFPLFTFGALIAGPLWAEASWGRYWGWDPKEVWAFISWIVYAAYLHARATPSVKRTVATWIALLGFVTMLMNLFGVNLFFEGLHSYANAGD